MQCWHVYTCSCMACGHNTMCKIIPLVSSVHIVQDSARECHLCFFLFSRQSAYYKRKNAEVAACAVLTARANGCPHILILPHTIFIDGMLLFTFTVCWPQCFSFTSNKNHKGSSSVRIARRRRLPSLLRRLFRFKSRVMCLHCSIEKAIQL